MKAVVELYWAGYAISTPGVPLKALLAALPLALLAMIATIVLSGAMSDFVGHPKLLLSSSLFITGAMVVPLSYLFEYARYPHRVWPLTMFHFLFFGLLCGIQQGCFPALVTGAFSPTSRCTGVSLAYSISRFLAVVLFFFVVMHGKSGGEKKCSNKHLSRYPMVVDGEIYLVVTSLISAVSALALPVSSM